MLSDFLLAVERSLPDLGNTLRLDRDGNVELRTLVARATRGSRPRQPGQGRHDAAVCRRPGAGP
jgi:hypothetical protein